MSPKQSVEPLALRPKQAAKALGISERTLWALTAPRGPIPCVRLGQGKRKSVLYPVPELRACMSREAQVASARESIPPAQSDIRAEANSGEAD